MTKGTGEERAIIIGFPHLYPDELLYSGCARFSDYRRYPNRRHVPEELFGNPHQSAIIDLPIRLTYLVEHLPPEHGYTVEQLITHHTFYPFYAPFLQPEQRKRLYEDMCGNHGRGIQLRAGISSRGIASPASLRFCPVCVEADRERYGEAYWHRSHQLPSILVCAHHGVFLEDSHISTRANHGADSYTFFSAERHVRPACPRVLDTTQHEQNVLFALAKDAVWVLTHPGMSFEPDCYLPRYHLLLQEHGYITIRDFVWISKLVDEFIAYYTREVLERLQCQPANTGKIPTDYWLRRLMQKHGGDTFHPVQHLLLIQFVGHSVQRFLETPAQPQFFGTGPWPCLNRFCNHYQQEVITECVIQPRLTGGKVEGIFECSCGFVYARTQHSNARQSTLGYSRVVSYGDVWKAGFTHLWNDPQISVKSIAHTIHIAKRSVVQFAAFLNLSFEHRQIKPPKHVTFFEQLVSRQYRRDRNRQLITDTLNAHPDITRTELRVRHSHAMQWLQRYDPDWLNEHMPPQKRKIDPVVGKRAIIDWNKRDTELAVAVENAAATIRELPGRPLRINRASLSEYMPQEYRRLITSFTKCQHHLPSTREILKEVIDTDISFARKRIQWAKEECLQGRVVARWTAFREYALIKQLWHIPEVVEAFEQTLAELQRRACD